MGRGHTAEGQAVSRSFACNSPTAQALFVSRLNRERAIFHRVDHFSLQFYETFRLGRLSSVNQLERDDSTKNRDRVLQPIV
jgi:hypothetical protein